MGYYYKSFKYRPSDPDTLYSIGARQTGSAYYDTKFTKDGFNIDPHGVGYFVANDEQLVKHEGEWVKAQNIAESILTAAEYSRFVEDGWKWGVWKVEGTPRSPDEIKGLYDKGLLNPDQPLIGTLVKDLRIIEKVDHKRVWDTSLDEVV